MHAKRHQHIVITTYLIQWFNCAYGDCTTISHSVWMPAGIQCVTVCWCWMQAGTPSGFRCKMHTPPSTVHRPVLSSRPALGCSKLGNTEEGKKCIRSLFSLFCPVFCIHLTSFYHLVGKGKACLYCLLFRRTNKQVGWHPCLSVIIWLPQGLCLCCSVWESAIREGWTTPSLEESNDIGRENTHQNRPWSSCYVGQLWVKDIRTALLDLTNSSAQLCQHWPATCLWDA